MKETALSTEEYLENACLSPRQARLLAADIAKKKLMFLKEWLKDDSQVFYQAIIIAQKNARNEATPAELEEAKLQASAIADTIKERAKAYEENYRKTLRDTDGLGHMVLGSYVAEWFGVEYAARTIIDVCLPDPYEAVRAVLCHSKSTNRSMARSHTSWGSIVDEIMDNHNRDERDLIGKYKATNDAIAAAKEGAAKVRFYE